MTGPGSGPVSASDNPCLLPLRGHVPGVTHHTVQVNGLRVHHVLAGEGPRWCCCTSSRDVVRLADQIPVLAEHYSLIVPDLRGYGDTDKAAGPL